MTSTKTGRSKIGAWVALILVGGLAIGTMIYHAVRYPLIRSVMIAEAAAADAEGESQFEALGLPPGAKERAPGEKRVVARSDEAPARSIVWTRDYDVPGRFEDALEWYGKHLPADGWAAAERGQPSELVRRYRKDKWLVTISQGAFFERSPSTRIHLRLEWRFRAPQH